MSTVEIQVLQLFFKHSFSFFFFPFIILLKVFIWDNTEYGQDDIDQGFTVVVFFLSFRCIRVLEDYTLSITMCCLLHSEYH